MKTTVLTGFVATALLVCGVVFAVHLALSGLDHLDFGGTFVSGAGR